jgi:hypothetical protein
MNLLCKIIGHDTRIQPEPVWINYGIWENVYSCRRCEKENFRCILKLVVKEQRSQYSVSRPCEVKRIIGEWCFEDDDIKNFKKTWRN